MALKTSAPGTGYSLPGRLFFSFGLICLLLAAVGGYVAYSLHSLQHLDETKRAPNQRKIALLRDVAQDAVHLQAKVLQHHGAARVAEQSSRETSIARIRENNAAKLSSYRRSPLGEEARRLADVVAEAGREYEFQTDRLLGEWGGVPADATFAKWAAAEQSAAYDNFQKSLRTLIRAEEDEGGELAASAATRMERTKLASDILIGIAIVVAAGTGITIGHVVRRLRNDKQQLIDEIALHRQTGEALHENRERYRVLLERIPDAIYVICERKVVFVNPAAERLLAGASGQPVIGRDLEDFVLPEDRSQMAARALEVADRIVPAPKERQLLRLDGTRIEVETNSMPTVFQGKAAIQVITRDIAERKAAEEKLRAQERQYRLLFEDSPSPMWVFDPATLKFLAANRAATKHYGYTKEEFLRLTLLDIRPPTEEKALRDAIAQIEAPTYYAGIWQHLTKTGRALTVEVHSCPIVFDGKKALLTTVNDITTRAESERKIRESETSLALAQHVAGVGSWEYEFGPDGQMGDKLTWSAEVYRLFGRSPDFAPSNVVFFQAVHPDDRAAVAQTFRDLQATGQRLSLDHRIVLPDGRERCVHVAAEVIKDEKTGRRQKVIGTLRDITEQVAAAAALKQAEEKYRAIFTNASEGIFQSTPEGEFLDVNPAAARIFGFASPKEMKTARSDITRQSYVDPQRRHDFIRLIEEQGVVNGFECEVFRKAGSKVWISENARTVRDAKGRTLYYEGTLQDITERKDAVRQLREQADLLNLAHDAIMVRDMEDRVQFWNQGAERLYGWTEQEVIGRPIVEILTDLDPSVMRAAHETFLEKGEWSGEKRDRNRKGDLVIVHSRWSLVRDELGQPKSKLVINTDITAQKTTEEQLLRTQRLESIGTLASGIAHDLNNVLLPILMAAPILRDEPDQEERARFLDIVEASAQRGASIVKQVVTFARGADGERVLLQPSYLVEEIAQIIRETFPKSITLSTRHAHDLSLLEGDPTQLHQVLLNLCINARDAMPEGGLLVLEADNFELEERHASTIAHARPGAHVRLVVADSGQGIPPEILPKIFDPFFTTKGVGEGTGLGLSTVAGIVRGHGGSIQVTSEPGQTRFEIYLPSRSQAGTVAATSTAETPAGHGQTILLVDDEAGVRKIAEAILTRHGYRVVAASNGPEALAVMAHFGGIDLVLTDLAMPIMNGLVLVSALRKIDSELKVILSTGRANDFDAAEIVRLKINDTLPKPYTQANLLSKVATVLAPAMVAA